MFALAKIYEWMQPLVLAQGGQLRYVDADAFEQVVQTSPTIEGEWFFQSGPEWEIGTNSINDGFQRLQVTLAGIWTLTSDIERGDRIQERARKTIRSIEIAPIPVDWQYCKRDVPVIITTIAGCTVFEAIFNIELPMEAD